MATLLNQPGATTPPSGATRATALHWAGALAYYQGDYPASRVLLKESLTLRRQAGEKPVDERGIAETLVWLACLDDSQQEYFPARDLLEDALQTAQQAQDKHGYAFALMGMGELLRLEGDVVAARALYEQSLALYRELGDKRQVAVGLMNLGLVALRERDSRHAATFFKEALVLATELDNKYYTASCLAYAAAVRALRNELHPTAQLFGAAEAHLAALGTVMEAADRIEVDHHIDLARDTLGPAAWADSYRIGQAMSLNEAIAYAMAETDDS